MGSRARHNGCDESKVEKWGRKTCLTPGHGDTIPRNGNMRGLRAKGTCRVIHRTTHREVTYRLTDNGDSVTKVGDVGDHITNDGGTEQRTQKEVG